MTIIHIVIFLIMFSVWRLKLVKFQDSGFLFQCVVSTSHLKEMIKSVVCLQHGGSRENNLTKLWTMQS